jgi:hypothetical protein
MKTRLKQIAIDMLVFGMFLLPAFVGVSQR